VVQPQRRAAHGRGGHDEEHAGDAGRLNTVGEKARGEPSSGRRPCCIENTPGAARVKAFILAWSRSRPRSWAKPAVGDGNHDQGAEELVVRR
jgi:hypothetical protein